MGLGGFAMVVLSLWAPRLSDGVLGWAGIGALLLTVHLGYADVLSGLLRRAGFPAGAGWGLPSCYLVLHGVLVALERHLLHPQRWPGVLARMWTWSWLLVPLLLLFHAPVPPGAGGAAVPSPTPAAVVSPFPSEELTCRQSG